VRDNDGARERTGEASQRREVLERRILDDDERLALNVLAHGLGTRQRGERGVVLDADGLQRRVAHNLDGVAVRVRAADDGERVELGVHEDRVVEEQHGTAAGRELAETQLRELVRVSRSEEVRFKITHKLTRI
jgi:hypothetical protein